MFDKWKNELSISRLKDTTMYDTWINTYMYKNLTKFLVFNKIAYKLMQI